MTSCVLPFCLPACPPTRQSGHGMETLAQRRERTGEGWDQWEGEPCQEVGAEPHRESLCPTSPSPALRVPATRDASSLLPRCCWPHRSRGLVGCSGGDAGGHLLLPVSLLGDSSPLPPREGPHQHSPPKPLSWDSLEFSPPRAPQFTLPYLPRGWKYQTETLQRAQAAEPRGEGQVRCQRGWGGFSCSVLGCAVLWSPSLLCPGCFGSNPVGFWAPFLLLSSGSATPTPCFENGETKSSPAHCFSGKICQTSPT